MNETNDINSRGKQRTPISWSPRESRSPLFPPLHKFGRNKKNESEKYRKCY